MRKRNLLNSLLMMVFLTVFANVVNAQNYLPVERWPGPMPAAEQDEPVYLEMVMDPVYHTYFKKATDGDAPIVDNQGGGNDRTYYSLRPVFNENSSLYVLNGDKIYTVDDNEFIGHLWYMVGNTGFKNAMWSKVDPEILYGTMGLKLMSLNVIDTTLTVIRDMDAEDGFISDNGKIYMDNKQSISGDDQYVVLSDIPHGGKKIVVVDIQTGERHAWVEDAVAFAATIDNFELRDYGSDEPRMNVGISPYGNYIIIGGQNNEILLDDQFNYIRHLANHGHADFAIDTEGNQVYVSICPAKYEILNTGELIDLMGETYACGHLNGSANYKQPGWAYLSINKDNNDVGENGNKMGYEVIAVKLDGVGDSVRRVVHPHNTGDNNELSAYAVPNPDGTLLMFNSTWDSPDWEVVNAYMVNLESPYTLTTTTQGNGTVSSASNGEYFYGTEVQIQAFPQWGFDFIRWEGDLEGTENPVIITINSNTNITAVFTDATGIFDTKDNSSRTNLSCFPNPSKGITDITFELEQNAMVRLSIFNNRGQEVSVLLNDNQTKGEHSIQWNGVNNSGSKLGHGVYIVKLMIDNVYGSHSKLVVSR